jgi:hypothetical protein
MKVSFNDTQFLQDMNNLVEYSIGFIDGAKKGKAEFLQNLGAVTVDILKNYVDSAARNNPQALHHIYEWYQVGSPEARLFDIKYSVTENGLSMNSTFSQSQSIQQGSKVPFYDKARIMEDGIPVVIKPIASDVLAFEDSMGQPVFTKNPVVVQDPGGPAVQGAYEKVFDEFFKTYFSQAFLKSSGIIKYLENPIAFSENFAAGKRGGKSLGESIGYKWIVNAGVVS